MRCATYIMFYTNSTVTNPSGECGGVQIRELVDNMPADSDVTLPPNPLLDEAAHGHHHHHAMAHSSTPGAEHVTPTGACRSSTSCSSLIHSQPGLLWVRAFPALPFSVGPCVPDLIHLYIIRTIYIFCRAVKQGFFTLYVGGVSNTSCPK